MKEYMFYIRNKQDAKKSLTGDEHLAFVRQCEVYIGQLKAKDQLIAAQPLVREGISLSRDGNQWIQKDLSSTEELQVGYYHIKARNMDEAMAIAKDNPEFAYVPSASIEIRLIKTKEEETGFVYPK